MSKHQLPPFRKEASGSDDAAFLVDLRTGKAAPLGDITLLPNGHSMYEESKLIAGRGEESA